MAATTASAYSGSPADSSAPGRSTATASWPRARSSGTTRCQYQAAPPAPGMRMKMLIEALRSLVPPCMTDRKTRDHRPAYQDRRLPERPALVLAGRQERNGASAGLILFPVRHEQRHGFPASPVLYEQGYALTGDGHAYVERDDEQRAEAEPDRE